jgi:hypothetical protein
MKQADLKRAYDYCISLGSNCMPAIHLNHLHLKQATLPLDWVVTASTEKAAQLLLSRFSDYMELKNLIIKQLDTANGTYNVEDPVHEVVSYHDFDRYRNTAVELATYPEFKAKLNRRIDRLYNVLEEGESFLFIRTDVGSPEEAQLLKSAIDQVVGKQKTALLLIVNCTTVSVPVPMEIEWDIPGVCTVEIPLTPNTVINKHFLRVLNGITLTKPDSASSETV